MLGWSFSAGALSPDRAGVSDDPRLTEEVRSHGINAHLLVADADVTLIGVVVDGSRRSRFPLYVYSRQKVDGNWSPGEGDCRPWAVLAHPRGLGGRWRLDPAYPPPGRGATVLHALVTYPGCPQAVNLRGRPRVVTTDAAVVVVVPVGTVFNSDACSPGEPTPVTIRLPEPLAGRTLYDAGTLPLREVPVR